MFHANAWCFPFSCTMVGAKQVFPGPHLDPQSLARRVRRGGGPRPGAGVPTIWMGIRRRSTANPGGWDPPRIRLMTPSAGAARPRAMIEAFSERHGLHITHGWGMTETSPIGPIYGSARRGARPSRRPAPTRSGPSRARRSCSSKSALAAPEGRAPWNGESMGELEVRGPWIAAANYDPPEEAGTGGATTAGSAPATSLRWTPTATSRSPIAPRTS